MIQSLLFVTVALGVLFTIPIKGNCPALQSAVTSSSILLSSGGLAIWSTGSFPGGPLYKVGRHIA